MNTRYRSVIVFLSVFAVLAFIFCPAGNAQSDSPVIATPVPIAPLLPADRSDRTALVYADLNGILMLTTVDNFRSIRKSAILSGMGSGFYDAAIDRRNGRKDIYIAYYDPNRKIFELITVPNNDFSLRTVQALPFGTSVQSNDVFGLRLELGTDSANKVMPVVATIVRTHNPTTGYLQHEIKLAYRVNQIWKIIQQPPYPLASFYPQELGLSLDTQNGITVGANLVFHKIDLITQIEELFTVEYNFIYGGIPNPAVAMPGTQGLWLVRYLVSDSNLLGGGSTTHGESSHCSSRNNGQWKPLMSCWVTEATSLSQTHNIFGLRLVNGGISFAPIIENVGPNINDLKFGVFDLSGAMPVINSILLERVQNAFSLSINKVSLGPVSYPYFYITAVRNTPGELALYAIDNRGQVEGPIIVESSFPAWARINVKVLALD